MEIATNNIVFQLSSSKYNGNYIRKNFQMIKHKNNIIIQRICDGDESWKIKHQHKKKT